MKNYFDLKRAILNVEESMTQKEPFVFDWAFGSGVKFDIHEELYCEYDKRRLEIKKRAAKEMHELFVEMLKRSEELDKQE